MWACTPPPSNLNARVHTTSFWVCVNVGVHTTPGIWCKCGHAQHPPGILQKCKRAWHPLGILLRCRFWFSPWDSAREFTPTTLYSDWFKSHALRQKDLDSCFSRVLWSQPGTQGFYGFQGFYGHSLLVSSCRYGAFWTHWHHNQGWHLMGILSCFLSAFLRCHSYTIECTSQGLCVCVFGTFRVVHPSPLPIPDHVCHPKGHLWHVGVPADFQPCRWQPLIDFLSIFTSAYSSQWTCMDSYTVSLVTGTLHIVLCLLYRILNMPFYE